MTVTEKKSLENYGRKDFEFSPRFIDMFNIIDTKLEDVKEMGPLSIDVSTIPTALLTRNEFTIKVEIRCEDRHSPDISKKTENKIIDESYRVSKISDLITKVLFNQDFDAFAVQYAGQWVDSRVDDKHWTKFSFSNIYRLVKSAEESKIHNVDYIWKVGDIIFHDTTKYPMNPVVMLIWSQYCDEYIPGELQDKSLEGWDFVTKDGFAFLMIFLWELLIGNRTLSTHTLDVKYEVSKKNNFIPRIPSNWHQKIIKNLDIKDFEVLSLRTLPSDKDEKDSDDDKEPSPPKKLDNLSREKMGSKEKTDIMEEFWDGYTKIDIIEHGKLVLESQLDVTEPSADMLDSDIVLPLSELLTENTLPYRNLIYEGEFAVKIDTNIVEGGVSIEMYEMLVAICTYGTLQILIEDSVHEQTMQEIESIIERRYGQPIMLYRVSDGGAFNMLKRSE